MRLYLKSWKKTNLNWFLITKKRLPNLFVRYREQNTFYFFGTIRIAKTSLFQNFSTKKLLGAQKDMFL